jgi:hypothetical protein
MGALQAQGGQRGVLGEAVGQAGDEGEERQPHGVEPLGEVAQRVGRVVVGDREGRVVGH